MRERLSLQTEVAYLLAEDPTVSFEVIAPPPRKATKEPHDAPEGLHIPFAPPPSGGYWPLRSTHPWGRQVTFRATDRSFVGKRSGLRFLADRKGKRDGVPGIPRWHSGIDLLANPGEVVVACEKGTIKGWHRFYKREKTGEVAYCVLIEHAGVVANYGEVTKDSLTRNGLGLKSDVEPGQPIGFVSGTKMLHFETYVKGTTRSHKWWKDEPRPPAELLNPTKYLLFLQEHGLPQPGGSPPPAAPSGAAGTIFSLPSYLRDAVRAGTLTLTVAFALLSGERDVNNLTNLVFFGRYPGRGGKHIDPATEPQLVKEWLGIRDQVITPLVRRMGPAAPATPVAVSSPELEAPTVAADAAEGLRALGYDLGSGGVERLVGALRDFQGDLGLPRSGQLDATATARLQGLVGGLRQASTRHGVPMNRLSRFRLTSYYVTNATDFPDNPIIPVLDRTGRELARVDPALFLSMSVEGTGRLRDGRLLNVTGTRRDVTGHPEYQQLLDVARRSYKSRLRPDRIDATGVRLEDGRVTSVLAFHEVPQHKRGVGYGSQRGVPLAPFRTLAADLGKYRTSDRRFKGKGGLVPALTRVFIVELAGLRLPDGTTHDGWCVVNDTGGKIFGAHFDVFTGSRSWSKAAALPRIGHVWFDKSEERCPPGYVYGLTPG
jgi:murein DD-endopeptidase MepM/ murein hydrolase activator NlpD